MNELDFLARWKAEKPLYEAWAGFISMKVHEELRARIAPISIETFIKVPVKPRLKADSTLIDKALYRKNYENPYDDVTDKVGMRFVVLLTTDIKKICEIIDTGEKQNFWIASKDRDYERERLDKPLEFSYQSVHYVLRPVTKFEFQAQNIPEGITCEVQIRTLLQHAYSELTHDTIYKPKVTAQPSVKRTVAKSMALIEATDEFFEKAIVDLNEAVRPSHELLEFLETLYKKEIGLPPGKEISNQFVIDSCLELSPSTPYKEIIEFLQNKAFIVDRIKVRSATRQFFSQPVVLLAYYLAYFKSSQLKEIWPLDSHDLASVFSDLGKRFEI